LLNRTEPDQEQDQIIKTKQQCCGSGGMIFSGSGSGMIFSGSGSGMIFSGSESESRQKKFTVQAILLWLKIKS
jgi:hypothetical protein